MKEKFYTRDFMSHIGYLLNKRDELLESTADIICNSFNIKFKLLYSISTITKLLCFSTFDHFKTFWYSLYVKMIGNKRFWFNKI